MALTHTDRIVTGLPITRLGFADPREGPEGEALTGEVLRELVGPLEKLEAGGLAGHLRAAVVVRDLVVVEEGVAAPERYRFKTCRLDFTGNL